MSSQLYQSVLHNTTPHSAKQKRLKQWKTAAVLIIEILPAVYSSRQAKHQHLRSVFLHKHASYAQVFIMLERLDLREMLMFKLTGSRFSRMECSSPDLQLISMQIISTSFQTVQRTTITLEHRGGQKYKQLFDVDVRLASLAAGWWHTSYIVYSKLLFMRRTSTSCRIEVRVMLEVEKLDLLH